MFWKIMTRSPDILFRAEYIKNVLYFATVRSGKTLKNTSETHYFCTDDELVYENYYSDFGPLNLGCVYKYCKILNEKLNLYLNKQTIVHYTASDPKKKANSAFLLGCFGVIYLSLLPRDALKPLLVQGQNYRPFQDATQGDSDFTISLIDCLHAIRKARDLGLFNFHDFNYEEYERLDKIQGGDLNWIVPGKFIAFIGPVDYTISMFHPPGIYIDYFLENNVEIVIRLNKRLYDGNEFNNAGIVHYDLYFPDGSNPPRHILQKFLQISEESNGAIAVHCKAGLGRTGSLIGCYLIKHYGMTAHEAIAWMRICRPGSVIGHQQGWLEHLEAWLLKQGNLYRKRLYSDIERMPHHEFGVYSIAEKSKKPQSLVFRKSPSPPPPAMRVVRTDLQVASRPKSSKIREDKSDETEKNEVFLTSCDLTIQPNRPMTKMKGCIIRSNTITEDNADTDISYESQPLWKKWLFCKPCTKTLLDVFWAISVRCARLAPGTCYYNRFCSFLDMVAAIKTEKEQLEWRVRSPKTSSQKIPHKGEQCDGSYSPLRRRCCAGEPRPFISLPRPVRSVTQRNRAKIEESNSKVKPGNIQPKLTTFRSSNGPNIKNVNDARQFLISSSIRKDEQERQLSSSVIVTRYSTGVPDYTKMDSIGNTPHLTPFTSATRTTQPQQRRRLGRSPSPPVVRISNEQTRATNTPHTSTTEALKCIRKDNSKSTLTEALSRLKLTGRREGSVGAASLGARRDAPAPKQAPSVRSDERPLATQGDLLNSIKFQRRFRDTLHNEKLSSTFCNHKTSKERSVNKVNSILSTETPQHARAMDCTHPREKPNTTVRHFAPARPSSPKERQRTPFY